MKIQVFQKYCPPPPISMLIALANHSFPGSASKNLLCNSFNIETGGGGGGQKFDFFNKGPTLL